MNPQFIIFCGPMFATKSSKLLMMLEKFKYQNKSVIAFKPVVDNRYDESNIVTHMGWSYPAVTVSDGLDIMKHLTETDENYDVVAVDEVFMLEGISEVLIWLYKKGFTIVCSTLDLSSQGIPFDEVQRILPYATHVEKCTAVCTVCGADAFYTHRKLEGGEHAAIAVGGSELYEPRCWTHCINMNKAGE